MMAATPTDDDFYDEMADDDGLDEDGNFPFECPRHWVPGGTGKDGKRYKGFWHCPLAGTEECDWECKEG